MQTIYSLAYLTYATMSPPDAISLAARCGYKAIGLRALPAVPRGDCSPLIEDAALRRETKSRAGSEGIAIFDMEIVRLKPDFTLEQFEPFLAASADLGARAVLVGGDDPDEERLTANYAAFCDAALPYGLTADLEFMPWSNVPDAETALRVVTAANRPNAGILVDTLHAARSRSTPADIAQIPARFLHYAQICDAPAEIPSTVEGLLHTARHERLLPGTGGISLRSQFNALARHVPVSIELPHDVEKAARGIEAWSRAAIEAARQVLAGWQGPAGS